MKKHVLILCGILLTTISLVAQSVGINTLTPHPNAVLDIKGVNKGLLIPRGDSASRNSLNSNTAKGLMMYDTVTNLIWVHTGNGLASGWQSLSAGPTHWSLNGALGTEISNTNSGGIWSANTTTVLSDPGPVLPPVSGAGTRMMWLPQKSAFRAGTIDAGQWDASKIGNWSFAGGLNTIASHSYSFAMGAGTSAKGLASTALGWFANANGDISTSLGYKTTARSYASVVIGRFNDSIAISNNNTWIGTDPLFMIGNGTSVSAPHNALVVYKNGSMVLKNPAAFYYTKLPAEYTPPITGEGTRMMWLPELSAFRLGTVTGNAWDAGHIAPASFAIGLNTIANGQVTTAMGLQTKASGEISTAMGVENIAKGYGSLAIGVFNDSILTTNQTSIEPTTPVFMIGNGETNTDRNNAMTVFKNGNMLLKRSLPVDTPAPPFDVPATGAGTRMMWIPEKSAFRAGTIEGTHWDASNMGTWSFAAGYSTIANGSLATSFGNTTRASGISSISLGQFTVAGGTASFASGSSTNASGVVSTAMGNANAARAHYTTAIGNNNIAKGFSSTVIGMYNDSILTANQTSVLTTTPLFIIGNGDGPAVDQRKNAMVVRKDGRVGLSTNAPAARLDVSGSGSIPTIPGTLSTGVLRVGVSPNEAVDIGKMNSGSFAGWIQAGFNGSIPDPLTLQPVGGIVGIGTTTPALSAALDVTSVTKGFLPPRMLFTDRNNISSPAEGLMIWCTNCGVYGQLQIYNGSFWSTMTGTPAVGLPAVGVRDGGGVIAYILQAGDPGYIAGEVHGLITTLPGDQFTGVWYGCQGTNIPGAEGTVLGTGNQNTIDITSGCGTAGIAAKLCSSLIYGGYDDWYLPSKDELNKLYLNRVAAGISGDNMWSSSEFSINNAWFQNLGSGLQATQAKNFSYDARAVRSF